MGNYMCFMIIRPCGNNNNKAKNKAKLFNKDGKLRHIEVPVKAGELMMEEVGTIVCELEAIRKTKCLWALKADEELQGGMVYLMFPAERVHRKVTGSEMVVIEKICKNNKREMTVWPKVYPTDDNGGGGEEEPERKKWVGFRVECEGDTGFPGQRLENFKQWTPKLEPIHEGKDLQSDIYKLFPFPMGNQVSHKLHSVVGKLVLSDGSIHVLDHPITVAELMLEHPQQVVVEFRPQMAGNKLTPLPADVKLDTKKAYLMLPLNRGKTTALSVDEARRILLKANAVLRSKELLSSTRILPLFARICMTNITVQGNIMIHRKDSFMENSEMSHKLEPLLENFEDGPEFLCRQFSGKAWKPSLDTIKEKTVSKKFTNWLF